MGTFLVKWYSKNISKVDKITFISTFVIGMLTHFFKFTNTLMNADSVLNFYRDQNILASGRWFLAIACGFSSFYDLPWIIGIISILFISLTAVIIVRLFKIENPIVASIIGGLITTFPAITKTFSYGFTADGYMMAMFLSAVAVYITQIGDKKLYKYFISTICICLSCGIYQSYLSFFLVLVLCYFIYELFENNYSKKEYLLYVRNSIVIVVIALILYYIIWKICMFIQGVQPTDYQGINSAGKISISVIINAIISSIAIVIRFFMGGVDDISKMDTLGILNILFLVFALVIFIITIRKTKIYKSRFHMFWLILALVLIPFCVCIWYFTSSEVYYYLVMLQSLCVPYILITVMCDKWCKIKFSNVYALLITIIVFNFAVSANISYFYLQKTNEESYATGAEMMSRIHMLESSKTTKIAFVGSLPDNELKSIAYNDKVNIVNSGNCTENLLSDNLHAYKFLNHFYSLNLDTVTSEELEEISKSKQISEMGIWPSNNSVAVIDNTIVIKLSEVNQ